MKDQTGNGLREAISKLRMSRQIFSEDHPCHGKSCNECETCIFDEPIPDKPPHTILPTCNECGYLIKSYGCSGRVFNASCGKHMIITQNTERARVIQRDVCGNSENIYRPDWCPKIVETSPPKPTLSLPAVISSKPVTYDDYIEKRNKMKALPPAMDWKTIREGDICVVPRILRQQRKILLVKDRTDYVLKCVELDENLQPKSSYVNIYSNDIDINFITKLHKF